MQDSRLANLSCRHTPTDSSNTSPAFPRQQINDRSVHSPTATQKTFINNTHLQTPKNARILTQRSTLRKLTVCKVAVAGTAEITSTIDNQPCGNCRSAKSPLLELRKISILSLSIFFSLSTHFGGSHIFNDTTTTAQKRHDLYLSPLFGGSISTTQPQALGHSSSLFVFKTSLSPIAL